MAGVRDVTWHRDEPAGGQAVRGGLQLLRAAGVGDDRPSLPRECSCRGETQATGCASDDSYRHDVLLAVGGCRPSYLMFKLT